MSIWGPRLLSREPLASIRRCKSRFDIPTSSVTSYTAPSPPFLCATYSTAPSSSDRKSTRPSAHTSTSHPSSPQTSRRCHHAFSKPRSQSYPRCFSSSTNAAELTFGQPVHETHPHLLAPGELTPGISALEYHDRRAKLASKLPKGAVAIVAASDVKFSSGSVFYEYKQNTDFLYLTGWNEPDSLAVIERLESGDTEDGSDYRFWMFVRPKDRKAEQWEGVRSGIDAARDVWNADEAHDISKVKDHLLSILSTSTEVHTDLNFKPMTSPSIISQHILDQTPPSASHLSKFLEKSQVSTRSKLKPLRPLINSLKIIKSPAELSLLRKAGTASAHAFNSALSLTPTFSTERQLDHHLSHQLLLNGCETIAFEPVVACGPAALAIHYVRNDALLDRSQLVLIDGGGEHSNYISDITRTVPVSLSFSSAQRDLYSAILSVQKDCISLCRASAHLSLDSLHSHAEQSLRRNLQDLGFDLKKSGAIDEMFPHHLSHYIGMDVHDCPGYSRKEELKPGMCVTVEPGIYVPVGDSRFPEKFWGMGIRIEDSVIVGEQQPEVLTSDAIKEVDEIELLKH